MIAKETSWNRPAPLAPITGAMSRLYQEVIVEHSKFPRFKDSQAKCRFCQEGKNPLCGDEIRVFLSLGENSTLTSAPRLFTNFDGRGCSISQASASLMCSAVQGISAVEARAVIKKAEEIYSGCSIPSREEDFEDELEALSGVGQFPVRVKCAALPWKSLQIILDDHFDESGLLLAQHQDKPLQCVEACRKKLRVVSTES